MKELFLLTIKTKVSIFLSWILVPFCNFIDENIDEQQKNNNSSIPGTFDLGYWHEQIEKMHSERTPSGPNS